MPQLASMPDTDDASIAEIQVSTQYDPAMALDDVKVTVEKANDVDASPMVESTRGASISTNAEHTSDIASIHSMPAVHITEPSSPLVQRTSPMASESTLLSTRPPPPSPARSSTLQDDSSITSLQRRARHRSAIEVSACIQPTSSIPLICQI